MKMTFKPADIIGDCIRLDKANNELANIDDNEINKKVAEIFPKEKTNAIIENTLSGLDEIFKNYF